MNNPKPSCPLCNNTDSKFYFEDKFRPYFQCNACQLVFVPPTHWLTPAEEKAVYDLHENSPQDQGYCQFLKRLLDPLLLRLPPQQKGLDFGSGPGPTLSVLLEREGHSMDIYDPYYAPRTDVLSKTFDFISATEVVEHLRHPSQEFELLFRHLKPGGWLGIMTKLVIDQQAFSRWHYIQDLTHICFYSQSTFKYIAERFNAELEFMAKDVIFLKKNL